ncbi:hypothetical protein HPP92_000119 [Vanilla planifolia]|uniref:Uncharacterized protein n=1 Tax=Vanilla planifolia TaxID=51239 RepID=A0A835VIE7_VANPL|nr:hypothetical protein HPP92_000119 [Vanilla planifolia]
MGRKVDNLHRICSDDGFQFDPNALLHPTAGGGAIQPAAALRADVEVLDGEVGRGNPDGELQDLILSDDLDDVDPEQEHLDADAAQIAEAVGRYAAGDDGLVTELVRTRKGEAASSIEVGREFSRSVV